MAKPTLAKVRFLHAINRLLQDMLERSDELNHAMADDLHRLVDRLQSGEGGRHAHCGIRIEGFALRSHDSPEP